MILSRASCTSRKKSRIFLLLFFLIILSPLTARDYRIGIVRPENPSLRVQALEDMLSFASSSVLNPELINKAEMNEQMRHEVEKGMEMASLIRAERTAEERVEDDDESPFSSVLVPLDLEKEELEFLFAQDEYAIRYLEYREDLDEILIIKENYETGLSELELIYSDGTRYFLLLGDEEGFGEKEALLSLIERYRGDNYSLIALDGDDGALFFENGQALERYGSYLVLEEGYHLIDVEKKGYYSLKLDCDTHKIDTLSYELEKPQGSKLYLTGIPYPDSLVYSGRKLTSPYIESLSLPYSISYSKEGYLPRIVQGSEAEEALRVELLPMSLYNPELTEKNKGIFYGHLIATLLSFGLSVASDSIYNLTGEA